MRPINKRLLLKLILLLAFFACKGQSYYFKHYQVDDGLAHNTVITIMQDSKGLMWLGTKGGLNSFDGYTFKTYKNEANRFGTIGNNVILSICEDKNGMIWVGTGRGIFKYDPYKEVFQELVVRPLGGITHILLDKKNNLWFLADGDLHYYDQTSKKITDVGFKASCLAFDTSMNLWMGNEDGSIKKYDPQNKTISTIQIIDNAIPRNLRVISKILPTAENEILIGTTMQGLKSYNLKTGAIKSLLFSNSDNTEIIYVRDIISSGKQEYWIATESGIYIYNRKSNAIQNLKKLPGDNYSINDNAVYSLCKDNHGNLWAGTFFGGLNYLSRENARFEKHYHIPGVNSISGNAVREICSDNENNIWIGTEDAGINKLGLKSGKFTQYTSGKPVNLSYPNIHALLAVGSKLYIGPLLHGLDIMDLKSGRITDHYKLIKENDRISSAFVMCIYQTADSTLLMGTVGGGLFSFDTKKKKFKRIEEFPIPNSIFVYSILEDHEGTIWTGSLERGAFYYNPKTGKKGNIRFNEKINGRSANDYIVQGIYEDSNHVIWFATEGGGLVKLSADRKSFKKFTTANGLPSNNIFRMLEDDAKNLWISSLNGLICLNLKTEKFKVYTQSNGLITDQFNYNSAFKDRNGKMYFGTVKGLIAFNPAELGKPTMRPSTYITGLQINNKDITPNTTSSPLKKSILYTDTILLNHNQSNFSIEFAALSYSSPKVTRYKYIMKGLDKDWTYLNSNRKAYFTDLSPGSYVFTVKAESNIGSWTGKERSLYIRIFPPFWKSNIAYLIYLFAFGIALYFSIRYYHSYLDKKSLTKIRLFEHQKEKEIYQAKIEFFTNIAHEIQTPLTLIIGPVEQVIKKVDEIPGIKKNMLMIEKNANRLLELTSQLLDFRKTEMDQFGLNFVNANITNLLTEQIAAFKHEAGKANINLSLELPKKQVIAFVDIEAFVKICSNLISNAVKYAATKATVGIGQFNTGDKTFTILFSNDGKAIPDEFHDQIFNPFFRLRGNGKPGTGIGLSLAKSLTELHNGSLKLTSGNTNFIVFELTLPVHQKFEFKLGPWKNIK